MMQFLDVSNAVGEFINTSFLGSYHCTSTVTKVAGGGGASVNRQLGEAEENQVLNFVIFFTYANLSVS